MTWLADFEQKAASTAGGTFNESPWRLVLHTTEGDSIEGAIASFAKTGSWPHFTVDAGRQRRIQHYPLSMSARALAHPGGTPETNRAGAIQIEIVGHAAESPDWPAEQLEWLGRDVVAPIRAVRPFPLTHPAFVGPEAGTIATAHAPQRLTWNEWATYSGIVGHQHVPGNDHWDPGRLDVAHIVAAVNALPEEDDFMAHLTDQQQDALVMQVAAIQKATDALKASALSPIERESLFGKENGLYAKVTALEAKLDKIIAKVGA